MMRGFSLLEFLIGTALFLTIMLAGYRFLMEEQHLARNVTQRTRPEIESNYRMMIVQTTFPGSTEGFQRDALLAAAPAVFPDLKYGAEPSEDSFSVAHPMMTPVHFVLEGAQLHVRDGALQLAAGSVLLLSGPDGNGNFTWDYVQVLRSTRSGEDLYIQYSSLAKRVCPVAGVLAKIEMLGLQNRQSSGLYWVHPSGESSAFLAVDSFHSAWDGRRLRLDWRCGLITNSFQVRP